jgi:tRNA modification GTPase
VVDPLETIVAIATPRGGAARGILRLSGPRAWQIVGQFFAPPLPEPTAEFRPRAIAGQLSLSPLQSPVPATLFLSRAPRSYTGQDLVEVHTLGSPPIVEFALSKLQSHGARAALPGEFTMRAFLNGKLDLTEAEAILGLIDATNSQQADAALRQMAGGIARPIGQLRDRLLDLLAELEAGLDFAEEDLEFIDRTALRAALDQANQQLSDLGNQMEGRVLSVDRRRAVLAGPPNVGKSTLFNALLGHDAAIVSHAAGTTRDYLVGQLHLCDCVIELADTAGIEQPSDAISTQAQRLRDQTTGDADMILWCVDSTNPTFVHAPSNLRPAFSSDFMVILTKCDLTEAIPRDASPGNTFDAWPATIENQKSKIKYIPVSSHTGAGLAELRRAIEVWVHNSSDSVAIVASTAARCRGAIADAHAAVSRARAALDADTGDDLMAAELRLALDALAQVVGAVYTDDILDRIFSRFCIGK